MYAIVEMVFVLYRSVLTVPAWMGFYGKDSDYFAAIYLVLKVTYPHVVLASASLRCALFLFCYSS